MDKRKVFIEHALNSRSTAIVWGLISTPEGLSRWMADEVTKDGNKLTFRWGEVWSNHQIHTATILDISKFHYIRMKWDHHEDEEDVVEIKMVKSEMEENYILEVTDFAEPDEMEDKEDLWRGDFKHLHLTTGL